MPKLSNLLGATGRLEIEVPGDEPLVVEYRRDVMTPRLQAAFNAAGTDDASASVDLFLDIYARILTSWNLTDERGDPIGTDAESLKDVSTDVLALVMREIGRQSMPDPTNGAVSNNGSLATESSASLQTITS